MNGIHPVPRALRVDKKCACPIFRGRRTSILRILHCELNDAEGSIDTQQPDKPRGDGGKFEDGVF